MHGVSGMIGSLLTAPLAVKALGGSGLPTGLDVLQQVGVQGIGVLVALGWSGAASLAILTLVDRFNGLRVGADDETEGLDLSSHNGKGYHL